MIRLMMLGPYEGKGRYRGGISTVVNAVLDRKEQLQQQEIQLLPFDTCRIQRENKSLGKLNFANVKNSLQLMKDAVAFVKKEKPDVFYLHASVRLALLKDLLVLRHVKKKTGIRTVLHIHYGEVEKILTGKPLLDKWMLSMIRKYVDELVLLSQQTLEQFVVIGIRREKCHLLYNFTSVSYSDEELREKLPQQPRSLLFVGLIEERKGIFDILSVLQQIHEPYRFMICGDLQNDQTRERFAELVKPLGEKVEFLGFVSGEIKKNTYRDADVLLLPSYGEGLPMVVLEALEAGCGVITTDVGAIPEILPPESGVIIKPGDLPALEQAIRDYLAMDQETLRNQQQQNHNLAAAYSLTVFVDKLAQISKAALSCEKG